MKPEEAEIPADLQVVKSAEDRVTTTITRVANRRYFPGLLLKNGLRLRITSTIKQAETTDSMNQPVLN